MKFKTTEKKDGTIQIEGNVNFNDPIEWKMLNDLFEDSKIEDAIDLLKKNGYVVFKPTFTKL